MFEQHAAPLNISPAPLPVVWTAPADRARAAALLPGGRPVVVLGPTANWPPKVWPADRFVRLFRPRCSAGPLPGAVPAVLAGPGARERGWPTPLLARAARRDRSVRPAEPAGSGRVIWHAARCMSATIPGLMHLAAAAGTPTIGLCGATLDRADEMPPAGLRAAWARGRDDTMAGLSVEDALAACVRLLETTKSEAAPLPAA